ncbi:MAG: hypothetical protein V4510_08300 [bacterium]
MDALFPSLQPAAAVARPALAQIAVLVFCVVAGCAGPGGYGGEDHGCTAFPGIPCEEGLGRIRLHDFEIHGQPADSGLTLGPQAAMIVVENASIVGLRWGIWIHMTDCDACHVVLRNVKVDTVLQGIGIDADSGTIVLANVTVTTAGGNPEILEPEGDRSIHFGGTDGVRLYSPHDSPFVSDADKPNPCATGPGLGLPSCCHANPRATIEIANLRITSHTASDGTGLGGGICPELKRLDLSAVSISSYAYGIEAWPESGTIDRVSIDCLRAGIILWAGRGESALTASGTRISGCRGDRPGEGIGFLVGLPARISDLAISDCRIGIQDDSLDLDLDDFSLLDNGIGLNSSLVGSGRKSFSNGEVINSSYAGLRATGPVVRINRVAFMHNGFMASNPATPPSTVPAVGGLVFGATGALDPNAGISLRSVRNASFEGNEPFAISASDPVDASLNWWGSPLGPSPLGRVPGFGDVVAGPVLTEPPLTAPP